MGQAASQSSLGSCNMLNCHGPHSAEWSLATCTRLATTTRADVAYIMDAAVASSVKARAGDTSCPDLTADGWFCRKCPSGRPLWHHISVETRQPWQEREPVAKAEGENQDIEFRKEYVVNRFIGFDEEAVAEHSEKSAEYVIHDSLEKGSADTSRMNTELESEDLYANWSAKISSDIASFSFLQDMKLRIESQSPEPTFDIPLPLACTTAAKNEGAAVDDGIRVEADANTTQPAKHQEATAKRSKQRQEKMHRPKAASATTNGKKLHHISIANLRAPSSTKHTEENPRMRVEDVFVW